MDIWAISIAEARQRVAAADYTNVESRQAYIFALPFAPESFDHVFVCFVLEHLTRPVDAHIALDRLLKPGGTMTGIEGDHGSTYFHPDSAARAAIRSQIAQQAAAGKDALIGRQVYPLRVQAGLADVAVSPRLVYVDASRPELAEGFSRRRSPP